MSYRHIIALCIELCSTEMLRLMVLYFPSLNRILFFCCLAKVYMYNNSNVEYKKWARLKLLVSYQIFKRNMKHTL